MDEATHESVKSAQRLENRHADPSTVDLQVVISRDNALLLQQPNQQHIFKLNLVEAWRYEKHTSFRREERVVSTKSTSDGLEKATRKPDQDESARRDVREKESSELS